jgi:hypothetical protein
LDFHVLAILFAVIRGRFVTAISFITLTVPTSAIKAVDIDSLRPVCATFAFALFSILRHVAFWAARPLFTIHDQVKRRHVDNEIFDYTLIVCDNRDLFKLSVKLGSVSAAKNDRTIGKR